MKNPLILYPIQIKNIANSDRCYWVMLEVNSGKLFHMPHMPGTTNLQKPRYFSMLIHMAYHTYHQHTLLWSLLRDNNHRLPHRIIDMKPKGLMQVQFILPKFMNIHQNLMEVHLQAGDSISFRESEFFSDYSEDLNDFGKN